MLQETVWVVTYHTEGGPSGIVAVYNQSPTQEDLNYVHRTLLPHEMMDDETSYAYLTVSERPVQTPTPDSRTVSNL